MRATDVKPYRLLPYKRVVELREDPETGRAYFLARIAEIPSIEIHGDTREEALHRLDEIFDDCVADMIEAGEEVPRPALWPAGVESGVDPSDGGDDDGVQLPSLRDVAPFTHVPERDLAGTAA